MFSDNERSEQQSRLRNTEIESNAWSTPSHFRNNRHSHNQEVTNESFTEKRITFGSSQQHGHYETRERLFENILRTNKIEVGIFDKTMFFRVEIHLVYQ